MAIPLGVSLRIMRYKKKNTTRTVIWLLVTFRVFIYSFSWFFVVLGLAEVDFTLDHICDNLTNEK